MADGPRKPRIRGRRIIERPRLIRALDRSGARVRTLVAAAGYGKTTLSEQWAPRNDRTVGWFRARRSAADAAVTARALVAACDAVVAGAGRRLLERLAVTQDPEREVVLLAEMLAEDLAAWPDEGWIVIDDYQYLAASPSSEAFVQTIVDRSPVRLLIASRVRPSWVRPREILDGDVLEIPQTALAMSADEAEEVLDGARSDLTSGLVALAGGWPAVIGLAGMVPDAHDIDAVLPDTLYEFFADELCRGLDPAVRSSLQLLAAMPLVDRDLAATLLGSEHADEAITKALALGILDERDGRLEFHPLAGTFFERRGLAGPGEQAAEVFTAAWGYYTDRNEPDAAFDLAHEHGLLGNVDALLTASMDDLLTTGRLSTLELCARRAARMVGETPAVLLAQAEIALRRGRHLSAQALADRAAQEEGLDPGVTYRAALVGGRAAHIGQREEDALVLYRKAEEFAQDDRQRRQAKWGRLTAAASLELESAHQLLGELEVVPRGDFDPTEALRTADKKLALGLRFGSVSSLQEAKAVEELLPSVSDPFVRCSFRCMLSCALNLAAEYGHALDVAGDMREDAAAFRIEFALPYASLMEGTALAGLRHFEDAHARLNEAHGQAMRCTDTFGLQAVYSGRVRALLHEGRIVEACGLEPPDLSNSLPGMRGEVWASRGLALACIGRLADARRLAELSMSTTQGLESTFLSRCVRAVVALKAGEPTLVDETRSLVPATWHAGAVDCLVTGYRGSPDLLQALLRDAETAETTGYIVGRAADHELAAAMGVDPATVLDPVSSLSARERDVYDLLCQGLSNREIAKRLFISVETVKVHARHVYDKLEIRSRTALALQAARRTTQLP
jgi:LuxR family transcriptional regulator, maltose regulon positive regulatory protein